ncbi:MAG: hypothetical protein RL108_1549 [Bacteroidota bacterium]|jgi:predicted DNA-binding transcriptional regulator YafY
MNLQARLLDINNLLHQKSFHVNFEAIQSYFLNQYGIQDYSERTFFRDIKYLKERIGERYPTLEVKGELLKFNRKENRYYYVREDISAFASLSERELKKIASIIEFNKHLFTDGASQGLVNKLRAISLENTLSNYHEVLPWPILQLIKDGERSGSEKLNQLIDCISGKRMISVKHRGLSNTSTTKSIVGLPLMIKEYNNGWYTGWYLLLVELKDNENQISPNINDILLLALDRIDSIIEYTPRVKVNIPNNFDPSDYFKNCMGILRNNLKQPDLKPEVVKIKIASGNWIVRYLQKYPLHASQRIQFAENMEGEAILNLQIEVNDELKSFILKYTDQLTVLEPEYLKNKIYEVLKSSLQHYDHQIG